MTDERNGKQQVSQIPRMTIIVIAKEPVAGRVKTRLCPPMSFDQAADLAESGLLDTIDAIRDIDFVDTVLYFDGDAKKYSQSFTSVIAQTKGDLSNRLSHAFESVDQKQPAIIIAMDTPQINGELLSSFDPNKYDACIGMTTDGGYWVIGFSEPKMARHAFSNIPMSTDKTGILQLEKLKAMGLNAQALDELTDFDDMDSAKVVHDLIPYSRFGRTFERIVQELK